MTGTVRMPPTQDATPSMSQTTEEHLIELNDVSVQFGRQTVLRSLSLSIPAGQTVAIIGESGCGKTVLMKTIIGLVNPSKGHVRFDGQHLPSGKTSHFPSDSMRH